MDLNYIVLYADKEGKLRDAPQRKILCFGDMIISGQRNGPVSPEPKKVGVVLASENAAAFDEVVCSIMGFNSAYIPLLSAIRSGKTWIKNNTVRIRKELYEFDGIPFKPHDGWKDKIE